MARFYGISTEAVQSHHSGLRTDLAAGQGLRTNVATHGLVMGQFVFQVPTRSGEAVDAGADGQHGVVADRSAEL